MQEEQEAGPPSSSQRLQSRGDAWQQPGVGPSQLHQPQQQQQQQQQQQEQEAGPSMSRKRHRHLEQREQDQQQQLEPSTQLQQNELQAAVTEATLSELLSSADALATWCSNRDQGRFTNSPGMFPPSSDGAAFLHRMMPQYAFNALCSPGLGTALRIHVVTRPCLRLGVNHGGNKRPLGGYLELLALYQLFALPLGDARGWGILSATMLDENNQGPLGPHTQSAEVLLSELTV
ncbi:hypothetical protein DUNSADRAFT_17009 [Dunaliella salina]|uniref:Uncharacterized protein n=1 Tax=Dunaliella salina TaxID=3046 RepID=A0ABQ7G2I3_DUNSA|nr:hypothetical protein DUNSADRAFT_17009 [Dunaliella salina]|eukprot:KAF5828812.1 hypothetical protein DUNSADRAFT_17009 [Dunaliella salina]